MKLTRKILKEMIEEVMLHQYGPAPARLRAEQKTPPVKKPTGPTTGSLASLVSFHMKKEGETKLFKQIAVDLSKDKDGQEVLNALKEIKVPKGTTDTSGAPEIFVALFHLVRAKREERGQELKYNIDTSEYGNYFTDVLYKMDNDDREMLDIVLWKALKVGYMDALSNKELKPFLSKFTKSKRSMSIPAKPARQRTPRRRVRKSASRYRNRAYVGAVQKIVNLFVKFKLIDTPLLTVDRSYGPKTRTGVKALQRKLGVKPDRYFGPKTACALDSFLKREYTYDSSENCKSPRWVTTLAIGSALEDMLKSSKKEKNLPARGGPPPFSKEDGKARPFTDPMGLHAAAKKAAASSINVPYLPGGNELSIAYANKRK